MPEGTVTTGSQLIAWEEELATMIESAEEVRRVAIRPVTGDSVETETCITGYVSGTVGVMNQLAIRTGFVSIGEPRHSVEAVGDGSTVAPDSDRPNLEFFMKIGGADTRRVAEYALKLEQIHVATMEKIGARIAHVFQRAIDRTELTPEQREALRLHLSEELGVETKQ